MSAISLKSITGITSITTPAGVDNQLTLHNNNTTEAVKLDTAGNLHFHNHLNITGISTAANFKTGTSNLHNTGLNVFDLDVDGHTNLDNVSIAGVTTTTDHIYIDADNKKLNIGDSSDLQLYHTGARSEIINNTGDLVIQAGANSNLLLRDQGGAIHFKGAYGAQAEIYHAGNKVLFTDALGVDIDGRLDIVGTGANDHLNVGTNTGRLRIGGYADLQLYHDSTNINYISNHNDIDLHITSTYGGSPVKTQAKFIHNGAVELYHNNDLRLQTWSDAVNIYGDEGEDAILHLYADEGDNNEDKWMLRAESSASRFSIENYSTGSWVENIRITAGGLVELKHADGTTKMHTDTTGITVANRITASGDSNTYINVGSSADTLDFYTGGSNYFRLNSDGNLLVNKLTTSDKGRFEVKGPTANDIETSDISAKTIATFSGSTPGTTAAGKGAGIVIKPISDRGCNYFLGVANDSTNQEAHGRFIIRSGNFYNQSVERLRIDANGNLIINGTTSFGSAVKLQVRGASSGLSDGGQIFDIASTATANGGTRLAFGVNEDNYTWIRSYESGTGSRDLVFSGVAEYGRFNSSGQFRAGDESSSDRTSYRHQFSSTAGSGDVLSLQNPSNSDGQGIGLGFWARNTNNAAIEVGKIKAVADETQANSTQKGSLRFLTNKDASMGERMQINSAGNVRITGATHSSSGTSAGNVPFQIVGGGNNVITMFLGNGSTTGNGVNDYSSDIRFNGAGVAWGDISYYPNGNGNGGAFRFTGNGSTVASQGNRSLGCSGIFINGTAQAQHLDDYEEGSWTPSFYPLSSAMTHTYDLRTGSYVKIGRVVYWQFRVRLTGLSGQMGQTMGFGGFPYNVDSSQPQFSANFYGSGYNGEVPTGIFYEGNVNRGTLYYHKNDAQNVLYASDLNPTNSYTVGSGFYFAA